MLSGGGVSGKGSLAKERNNWEGKLWPASF